MPEEGPPRRRGRPRIADPERRSVTLSTWVSAQDFDRLCVEARRRDTSLSGITRLAVKAFVGRRRALPDEPPA